MPQIIRHPDCSFTQQQIDRFCEKLVENENGCWLWTGCHAGDYGRVGLNGRSYTTHRVAYIMANGSLAPQLVARHKCDTPICCRPEHLQSGTHKQNSEDMVRRGRARSPKGEQHGNVKLKLKEVSDIKQAINEGSATQSELGRRYRVDTRTIHAIRCELSWTEVEPRINDLIPQPHRKFSDIDHVDIRQLWRDGWNLKRLAAQYQCRVDTIQAIISGKRGKLAPVGLRVIRQNRTKLTSEVRQELLRRYLAGETQIKLAAECGMSKNGISLALQFERRMTAAGGVS